ncbi:MAG TPA: hypothetical protein VK066_11620 [Chloroflexota bacterium]|nr:hypothetical protein [Chloroflexota bacterium]
MGGLEVFGTRSVRGGLGLASVGLGAVVLGRALGVADPLAAWAAGLGAVPLGAPAGIALAAGLLLVGALLLLGRGAGYAAAALALLLLASLLLDHPGTLGANLDLGLLGAALSLVTLPPALRKRAPARLAALVPASTGRGEPSPSSAQRLALRLGLALTFLLSGLDVFAHTSWYADLLTTTGGIAGWPMGGGSPTGLMLWLGTGEVFLSGLLVWGPPARLASAIAAVLLVLDLLALHTPGLLTAKAVGLLGAAIAGYCWASGATALENAQIGWLRATADARHAPGTNGTGPRPAASAPRGPDEP